MKTQNTLTPSRVLVVDDDHQTVVLVTIMLAAIGYRVDAANCGAAALDCLGRYGYDMVLTDLEMPEMMGDILALKIKEKWPETGVVIMTGSGREEMEAHRGNRATENWLSKPFNMATLEMTMNKVPRSSFNGSEEPNRSKYQPAFFCGNRI